jgi:hypothetical protein
MAGTSVTVLVTVRGPQRIVDLELSADSPVAALIPLIIDVCVPTAAGTQWAAPAYWGLGPDGGQPLPPNRTLVDCGILDGATLVFQDLGSWSSPVPMAPPPPPLADGIAAPQPQGGGITIRWNRDGLLS